MFRMYIDEVGTDDLATLQTDSQKYLSLTGVVMNVTHARDMLSPALHAIKSDIFNYDPDDGLCLHRKEIMGLKGKFGALRDTDLRARFDARMLQVFRDADYTVITAFIDKPWMLRQQNWKKTHPYHYLMEILVEKYTQLLERLNGTGDIMPEARHGKSDKALQAAFDAVMAEGTYYVRATRMVDRITARTLKFRTKKDNIPGLQLCDLLAHPSHYKCREVLGHQVTPGPFAQQVQSILWGQKYDRGYNGRIRGYGIKPLG